MYMYTIIIEILDTSNESNTAHVYTHHVRMYMYVAIQVHVQDRQLQHSTRTYPVLGIGLTWYRNRTRSLFFKYLM